MFNLTEPDDIMYCPHCNSMSVELQSKNVQGSNVARCCCLECGIKTCWIYGKARKKVAIETWLGGN